MGRRYFCDYCDRTFIDDLDARKKHLQSAQHISLRHIHYQSCRDPETVLREELLKIPCKRFNRYGTCHGNCKYTHYSPEQLCELRQQIEYNQEAKRKRMNDIPEVPSVESWMQKYNEQNNKESGKVIHTFWSYPDHMEHRTDLPPSLLKFRPEHFYDDHFEEWGN